MLAERNLVGLLEWYIVAGADEAIGDHPIDRYAVVRAEADRESKRRNCFHSRAL